MRVLFLSAIAAGALVCAGMTADAGQRGKDRGYDRDRGHHSQGYNDRSRGKDYGKREKRGNRDNHRGRGHKDRDYGHNPDPQPEPTPDPAPTPTPASKPSAPAQSFAVAPQDTDANSRLPSFMGHGHATVNDARVLGMVASGAIDPSDIEKTCEGGCWQVIERDRPVSEWRTLIW